MNDVTPDSPTVCDNPMADSVLAIKGANRTFHTQGEILPILKSVDLSVHRGQVTAIYAPSGSGKTTLLYGAGMLEPFDMGQVLVDGVDVSGMTDKQRTHIRRHKMGYIYQMHNLLPEFNALENLTITGRIAGQSVADSTHRAMELLAKVQLADRAHSRPSELSGGERQRVAIVRSLMNNPSVILADEPTGNLDTKVSQLVFDVLLDLVRTEQVGMLLVTHNPMFAKQVDSVVTLVDGYIEPLDKESL